MERSKREERTTKTRVPQKLAVIADNYQLLILTAPKAPAALGQCAEGARRAGAVRRRRPLGQQCVAQGELRAPRAS